MRGYKLTFFLIISFSLSFALENGINQQYDKALNAYRNNQYELAIQEFESILDKNWDSSELYYNLGNAFYRNSNMPGAIWAYESCLQLLPTHTDAKYNLKIANLEVIDRIDLPDPPMYLKMYMVIKERFSPSMWVSISAFLFLLFAISYSLLHVFYFAIARYSSILLVILFFCSLFFTSHSIWTSNSITEGILSHPTIEAMSEPNIFSTRLFKVHEGLKVSINQVLDNWVEIELLDGKSGWIQNAQIRLIQ